MTEMELSSVLNLIQTLGMWSVFAWLFITERRAHDETRRQWNEDLRNIAGLRQQLPRISEPREYPRSDD